MDDFITRSEYDEHNLRMEDEHRRQNHRIAKLEDNQTQINDLTLSVKELAMSVKAMVEGHNDHDKRIEVLESRDGEKWRDVSRYVLITVIGIFIGFIAKSIGF